MKIKEFHGDRQTGEPYTDTRDHTDACRPPEGATHADIRTHTETDPRYIMEDLGEQIAELQCEVDYNNTVIEKYRALVREYEQEIKQLKERLKKYGC